MASTRALAMLSPRIAQPALSSITKQCAIPTSRFLLNRPLLNRAHHHLSRPTSSTKPSRLLSRQFHTSPLNLNQPPSSSPPQTQTSPKDASSLRLPDRPTYELRFTCKPCGHRSSHLVSKQGYHHGSVLISCPSCRNRHVISDHLKIFGDTAVTIEDILREKGQLVKKGTLGEDEDIEFWEDGTTTARREELSQEEKDRLDKWAREKMEGGKKEGEEQVAGASFRSVKAEGGEGKGE